MAFPSGSFPNTRGANNPRSKLTEAQALHIRHCYKNGVCHKSLAAMFGVSPSTVRNIEIPQIISLSPIYDGINVGLIERSHDCPLIVVRLTNVQ